MAILPMVLAAAYFAINWGLEIIHNIENQANLVVNSMAERHVWSLEKAQVYISEMNAKMDQDDPIQPEDCQNLLNEYASIGGFVS
ncbi:MAG: hypothetical protein AB1453_15905, partial [Chloroflexota bacterium]